MMCTPRDLLEAGERVSALRETGQHVSVVSTHDDAALVHHVWCCDGVLADAVAAVGGDRVKLNLCTVNHSFSLATVNASLTAERRLALSDGGGSSASGFEVTYRVPPGRTMKGVAHRQLRVDVGPGMPGTEVIRLAVAESLEDAQGVIEGRASGEITVYVRAS